MNPFSTSLPASSTQFTFGVSSGTDPARQATVNPFGSTGGFFAPTSEARPPALASSGSAATSAVASRPTPGIGGASTPGTGGGFSFGSSSSVFPSQPSVKQSSSTVSKSGNGGGGFSFTSQPLNSSESRLSGDPLQSGFRDGGASTSGSGAPLASGFGFSASPTFPAQPASSGASTSTPGTGMFLSSGGIFGSTTTASETQPMAEAPLAAQPNPAVAKDAPGNNASHIGGGFSFRLGAGSSSSNVASTPAVGPVSVSRMDSGTSPGSRSGGGSSSAGGGFSFSGTIGSSNHTTTGASSAVSSTISARPGITLAAPAVTSSGGGSLFGPRAEATGAGNPPSALSDKWSPSAAVTGKPGGLPGASSPGFLLGPDSSNSSSRSATSPGGSLPSSGFNFGASAPPPVTSNKAASNVRSSAGRPTDEAGGDTHSKDPSRQATSKSPARQGSEMSGETSGSQAVAVSISSRGIASFSAPAPHPPNQGHDRQSTLVEGRERSAATPLREDAVSGVGRSSGAETEGSQEAEGTGSSSPRPAFGQGATSAEGARLNARFAKWLSHEIATAKSSCLDAGLRDYVTFAAEIRECAEFGEGTATPGAGADSQHPAPAPAATAFTGSQMSSPISIPQVAPAPSVTDAPSASSQSGIKHSSSTVHTTPSPAVPTATKSGEAQIQSQSKSSSHGTDAARPSGFLRDAATSSSPAAVTPGFGSSQFGAPSSQEATKSTTAQAGVFKFGLPSTSTPAADTGKGTRTGTAAPGGSTAFQFGTSSTSATNNSGASFGFQFGPSGSGVKTTPPGSSGGFQFSAPGLGSGASASTTAGFTGEQVRIWTCLVIITLIYFFAYFTSRLRVVGSHDPPP